MLFYWIQHADFGAIDAEADAAPAISEALLAHDWAAELAHVAELEAEGEEGCPPGLGINLAGGACLHIYFVARSDVADAMYVPPAPAKKVAPEKRSLFEFFSNRPAPPATDRHALVVPQSEWPEWIERFCASDHEWLVSKTR